MVGARYEMLMTQWRVEVPVEALPSLSLSPLCPHPNPHLPPLRTQSSPPWQVMRGEVPLIEAVSFPEVGVQRRTSRQP